MDSGVENVNDTVNELVSDGTIKRILAQVDIVESNSMIEAWWRQLNLFFATLKLVENWACAIYQTCHA
jgi:hypothetical protein